MSKITHNEETYFKTCLCGEKPEKNVTVKGFIDSEESCNDK